MKGLYNKYIVTKANGEPIDQDAYYLVLRLDSGQYVNSCRAGALQFAMSVLPTNPLLAHEIIHLVKAYQEKDATTPAPQACPTIDVEEKE